MNELSKDGKYEITAEMRAQLKDFYGNYATEEETAKIIKNCMKIRDISLIRIQQLQPAFMKNIKQLQKMIQRQSLLLLQVHLNLHVV